MPIWDRAGDGRARVDSRFRPIGFFLPIDEHNEHYLTLREFPGLGFYGSHFSKRELLEQRNRMIRRHPRTTFLLPDVANLPEDLTAVGQLLDANPNVVIDFSARIDELGRQPYTARDFFLRYQDRILFGLDMPVSPAAYRCYFRVLRRGTSISTIPTISAASGFTPVGSSTGWACPTQCLGRSITRMRHGFFPGCPRLVSRTNRVRIAGTQRNDGR